jgi:hypothetical protein
MRLDCTARLGDGSVFAQRSQKMHVGNTRQDVSRR